MSNIIQQLDRLVNEAAEDTLTNPNAKYTLYKRIVLEVGGIDFRIDASKMSTGYHDIRIKELAEYRDLTLPDRFSLLRPKTQETLGELFDYYYEVVKSVRRPKLPENADYDHTDVYEAFRYFYKFLAVEYDERMYAAKTDSAEVIAKRMIETAEDDSQRVNNGITIAPCVDGVARAFIPNIESFPERVRKLTGEDIAGSVFRGAELEIYMLALGRICVGRNNSIDTITGEVFDHKARLALLVLGKPGVGKTTIQDAVVYALKSLGYSYATVPKEGFDHKFIGPKVFTADLVYKDDMSNSEIENLSQSSNFKSSVTGGKVKAEDKNKDAVEVVPNAASYFNTNRFSDSVFNNSDDGAVDRMNIITTLDLADLPTLTFNNELTNEVWRDIKPSSRTFGVYLERLANKLEVEEETLIFWLFRLSVDKFMNEVRNGSLRHTHNRLRSKLDHVAPKDPIVPLIAAAQFATVLAGHKVGDTLNVKTLQQALNCLISLHSNMSKPYYYIKSVMKADWIESGCPWEHPYSAIKWMTDSSALSMYLSINEEYDREGRESEVAKTVRLNKTSKFMELALAETRIGKNNMKVRCSPADLSKFWVEGYRKLNINVHPLIELVMEDGLEQPIDDKLDKKWLDKISEASYSRQAITEQYEQN